MNGNNGDNDGISNVLYGHALGILDDDFDVYLRFMVHVIVMNMTLVGFDFGNNEVEICLHEDVCYYYYYYQHNHNNSYYYYYYVVKLKLSNTLMW